MLLCYIDEAGCPGALPSRTSQVQPILVIAAVIVDRASLSSLTINFLKLKAKFFPGQTASLPHELGRILVEIKGADLRKAIRSKSRNKVRHALGVLDHFFRLLEEHNAKIVGRIWIKHPGHDFSGRAVYTSSIQSIYRSFQHLLKTTKVRDGFVIADSRSKPMNAIVSHSIFTQKFKKTGDPFSRIVELPTFGHSENHAGIQVADFLCSALLFPMATQTYCTGHIRNVHVSPSYALLREKFGKRLRKLQYRYKNEDGRWLGGIVVSDPIGKQSSAVLFTPPKQRHKAPANSPIQKTVRKKKPPSK